METILLLCPHNAAKSIMAEAYYNHRVQQEGLPFLADSAGTEPSEQIWLTVIELLQREGIPLTSQIPRQVTRDDLLDAFQMISMGSVRSRACYSFLFDVRGSANREHPADNSQAVTRDSSLFPLAVGPLLLEVRNPWLWGL